MAILSTESEREIINRMEQVARDYLERLKELDSTNDIMTSKQVRDTFGITQPTLIKWEAVGLKRFEPPIEGTRSVYYLKSEILKFLSIDY